MSGKYNMQLAIFSSVFAKESSTEAIFGFKIFDLRIEELGNE